MWNGTGTHGYRSKGMAVSLVTVSATLFASVCACVRAGCVTCHVRRQPLCTHTRAQPTWSQSFLLDIFAMPFVSAVCDLRAATTLVCKTACLKTDTRSRPATTYVVRAAAWDEILETDAREEELG
ncbi:hypothetical protein IWZ03DRAFT_221304 [Phyllosticta citriasiana]|uniref:Secreted protein n=1 Tax=Phyllosticta citriasiana TaxID=595635 RepID=A0ABR1KLS6_9PEZI